MAGGWNYWLVKINRVTGWLLFILVLVFIVTGFSLCGMFGFSRTISSQTALRIHRLFDWPLVVIFLSHSAINFYFAMRRWGWIGRRARATRKPESRALAADKQATR
jgi:cytochrome b subunit of formate dehydrogenase